MRISEAILTTMFVLSAMFAVASVGMIINGAESGWLVFLFLGLLTAIFATQLWPELLGSSHETPAALLQRFPQPVLVLASRQKLIFSAIALALAAGLIFWLAADQTLSLLLSSVERILLGLGAIYFGAKAFAFIVTLLRGAAIRLDAHGFQVRHLRQTHQRNWTEVGPFTVACFPPAITCNDAKGGSGGSVTFQDIYELSPEDLASLLNQWRARALATQQHPAQSPPAP